jgi:hypothetical protein
MEDAWQEFRHQLRTLDYSLDWKADPENPETWSARDIVSHLLGTPERNALAYLKHTLKPDGSVMPMEAGNPVRATERRAASLAQLLSQLEAQYQEMRRLVLEATPQRLEAKGLFLGRSGNTEVSFLDRAYGSFHRHLREHTRQIQTLREELGAADL